MHRLRGFDYKRPYFYMVTLKRVAGLPALSRIVGDAKKHYLEANHITRHFVDVIRNFHNTWYCIEPITCFSIMPDHIHLLIKIRDIEKRVSLPVIVRMLMREKERFCAEGRMLFLSLYSAMDRMPTKQELYQRCHEMGDIVVEGLNG